MFLFFDIEIDKFLKLFKIEDESYLAKKLFEIGLEKLNFGTDIEILVLIMVYQWPLNLVKIILKK